MRKSQTSQRSVISRFLRYLTNIPDSSLDRPPDLGQIRRVYILRFISITAVMTLIPLGILALVHKNIPVGILNLSLASILTGNILHARRYKHYSFNIYLAVSLAAILFIYMFLTGGINRSGFVWYYTFPVVVFFLLGSQKGAIATALISSPVVALFLMKTPPSILADYSFDFKLRFLSSFLVVIVFSYLFEYSRERNREELQRARDDLEKRVDERTMALQEAIQSLQKEVSERRRIEEALRESEERYRTILEDIEESYFETDLAGHFTFVNDVGCRRLGYSREELMGMNSRQVTDEETAKKVFQAFSEVYRTGEPRRGGEWEIIRKDGTKGIFEISASLVRDSGGRPNGFRGTSRDVTERKQMEEALRQSEERYRTILEDIEEGYFEVDIAGNFTFVNDALCRRFGYPKEELIGVNNRQYTDEKNAKKLYQAFKRIYSTGEPIKALEAESIRRDGTKEIFEISVFLIRDLEGKQIGFRGTSRDVTERKRMEEDLRQSEEKYRTVLENIEDGYYEVDLTGNFTFFNDSLCRMLGYPNEELMGMNDRQYTDKENAKKLFQTFNKVYRTGQPLKGSDWEIIRKDRAKKYVEASISLRRDFSGQPIGFRGIARDVTERKRAEEALKEKTEELARSNRDLEQFAYVASHDLQEPLRMVTNYVQLLAGRYKGKLDSDADEFIGFAVDGATHMWKLVNDLLSYSRVGIRGKELEPTDCETVLDQTLNNLKVAIEEKGAVVTHDPLPTVMADSPQLGQLFQNLIGNAIKFRGNEAPRIHVSASRNGNGWTFSVCDNGMGIAPEYAERIFIIFQRLHSRKEYPGTGIGLAICKKIVERHGGRMWVESEVGMGATFYFTLPGDEGLKHDYG